MHEDVSSNKNDVIMCSCPGQACRSISSQTSVQLVGLGLVIIYYDDCLISVFRLSKKSYASLHLNCIAGRLAGSSL